MWKLINARILSCRNLFPAEDLKAPTSSLHNPVLIMVTDGFAWVRTFHAGLLLVSQAFTPDHAL